MRTGELWRVDVPLADLADDGDAVAVVLVVSPPRLVGPRRIVCPLTTTAADWPWWVEVPAGSSGLDTAHRVRSELVRALPVATATARLGVVDDAVLGQVRAVLARLLAG